MNIVGYLYFILYISYIILGEHFIVKLIKNDKLNLLNNFSKLKGIFFLSYLSFLFIGIYFLNPNIELFLVSLLVSFISCIFYIIKFKNLKDTDPYYWSGIVMHIITIIPLIVSLFFYEIDIKDFKFGIISLLSLIFLILYSFLDNIIYAKGENLFF